MSGCWLTWVFLLLSLPAFGHPLEQPQSKTTPDTETQNSVPGLSEAQALIDKGQMDQALKVLDSISQQHPDQKGLERLRGKAFYLKANFPSADAAFQKAIAQAPDDKESIQLRGVTLFRMGKSADAIPLLEQSHENLTTINLDGAYVLALCYMNVHKFDDARRYFASLYKLQPTSAASYLLLARMLIRWQNSPAAEEMAQKAIVLNPRLPEAHLLVGQVALGQGLLDKALSEFEHEAALNPMYGPVYDRLGDVYMQKNELAKAQDALNQALLLEPDATGPYILLGQVLLKQDNPATAAIYLKRAVQMDPGNEFTHFFLGQAYRDLGKKQESIAEFQAAEKIKSTSRH